MSKDEILKRLEKLNNIGKTISGEIKGTTGKENKGKILDEVFHIVDENRYVIQKIQKNNNRACLSIRIFQRFFTKRVFYPRKIPDFLTTNGLSSNLTLFLGQAQYNRF